MQIRHRQSAVAERWSLPSRDESEDDRWMDKQGEREGVFLFQCPEQVCRRPAVRSGLYSQPAAIDKRSPTSQ